MQIKKKYMSKENWSRVTKRKYVYEKLQEDDIEGIASLLHIKEVTSPCIKTPVEGVSIKIADNDFYWLQLGIKNKNYWITAMYNSNKELIQYYIDITLENVIEDNNPYYYDLFLDIILRENGEIMLLDEEELKMALKENVIDKSQYNLAYDEANRIIDIISKNRNILDTICNKYFDTLLHKLEN